MAHYAAQSGSFNTNKKPASTLEEGTPGQAEEAGLRKDLLKIIEP